MLFRSKEIWNEAGFKGKEIVTALPSDDLFIDPIKVPRVALDRLSEVALPKVQKHLPFPAEKAIIQYVTIDQTDTKSPDADVLVIAAERETVNRYLAIYEKTGLNLSGISIWPTSLIQCYTTFFCRRQNEQDHIAILLDVGEDRKSVV